MYNGEFRYVNKGPSAIRAKLETETDPGEMTALLIAMEFWKRKQPSGAEAGEPFRGEPRQAVTATSMLELGRAVKPVSHVGVFGSLVAGGTTDGGAIDLEMLRDG